MTERTTSLERVKARWAYSELLSPSFEHFYQEVDELKAKGARRTPFDGLSQREIAVLADGFDRVRGGYFNRFFSGVSWFRLTLWSKDELGAICIIPYFAKEFGREVMAFREWVKTPPTKENDPREEMSNSAPFSQEHPVTAVRCGETPLLLDGYHRACWFWKNASDPAAKLCAYVPIIRSG